MSHIPGKAVSWKNSLFLFGTLLVTLGIVPVYLWQYGLSWFQAALFLSFFVATGLSITVGYHRLYSHRAFSARWPVRWSTLLFGAAAFENSAMDWVSDHRRHHKFADHENDPYNITKGFFHAHFGWLLVKPQPPLPLDNVPDLLRDRLVVWQHRYYLLIAVLISFVLPAAVGFAWGGGREALGSFLLAGVARVVFVHHMTFFINSFCHMFGRRPYSSRCTARDSGFMALFTFGEGYHNFHHEFQHDYRNGVKPWQFDPTKWAIWLMHLVGLTTQLRRVPAEKILLAEIAETQRRLFAREVELPIPTRTLLEQARAQLQQAAVTWEQRKAEYTLALEQKLAASRPKIAALKRDFEMAAAALRLAINQWQQTYQIARTQMSCVVPSGA